MNNQSTPEKLRAMCDKLRRTNVPLADMIPLMQKAADELESVSEQNYIRKLEDELNCAEEVLDGYAAHLDLEETAFDCTGEYITAVCDALKKATAKPAQQDALVVPQGWKLVPLPLTPEMRKAAADAWIDCGDRLFLNKAAAALRAGIAAAPTLPAQQYQPEEIGKVVVTWNLDRTKILAVTRQDEDGKILKVIAEAP